MMLRDIQATCHDGSLQVFVRVKYMKILLIDWLMYFLFFTPPLEEFTEYEVMEMCSYFLHSFQTLLDEIGTICSRRR